MLEIIEKGSISARHPVPLLFIHGGCHAAWCWADNFLGYFADEGFRASAVSLRGHGHSTSTQPIQSCSMADYLDDVISAAGQVGGNPVVIGHSTGGFLIQKYLENHRPPAAVLLASTPPQGILRASMRIWRKHPWTAMRANTIGESHEVFNTPALARQQLFSPDTPEDIVRRCAERLEPDSLRAVFVDQAFRLPKLDGVTTPVLVLGGKEDGTISNREVHATAEAFGTRAELFPDMGHNMMLDSGWRDVATRITTWLQGLGL
ncbi:alpha/beta hydrolase [Mycolicibacterium litorale]|nr:alpha/beta hydrolase [Mycolicibacterium litorale]